MKKGYAALLFGVLGLIAGIAVVPYQLESMKLTMDALEYKKMMDAIPVPMSVMMAVAGLQIGVITFALSWIGMIVAERAGLPVPFREVPRDRSGWKAAILAGLLGAFVLSTADVFLFQPFMPALEGSSGSIPVLKALVGGALYGGIVEEVWMRLFLMSLVVWLIAIIARKKKPLPNGFYIAGIVVAALLFSAGHLPATAVIFDGLTPLLVVRAFALNGLLAVVFGWLYWKKGLEYAMAAHMSVHIFNQLLVSPLLKLIS